MNPYRWPWLIIVSFAFATSHATTLTRGPYHGWPEAFTLTNGKVEVVVVPAIGRIMQMRFSGSSEGPFWENRALDGKPVDSKSSEWINLGGDKTWPAPQGEWEKMTGRGWPPPAAFDSMPVEAKVQGDALWLTSPIDPHYGIATERKIELTGETPEMKVTTTYRKLKGEPVRVSIWTITQLKHPQLMFMPLPSKSIFPEGYNRQSEKVPSDLKVANGMVTCTRAPAYNSKIGSDSSRLIWAGRNEILEIISPREKEGEFPDKSSSAEIYTNSDPNAYVELELLGPLHSLKTGDSISRTNTYRLHRRASAPLEAQIEMLQH